MSEQKIESTITLTFGDRVENSVGMQMIGSLSEKGFSLEDLESAKKKFEVSGLECEIISLHNLLKEEKIENDKEIEEAYLLIVRGGVNLLLDDYDLMNDLIPLEWDRKMKSKGRVVNKHARRNLCFAEENQEPDYENDKGRIIKFDDVPCLSQLREDLHTYFGDKAENLFAEGNYYFEPKTTYIGYHGDFERRKVIGCRFGTDMNLHFQWYYKSNAVGPKFTTILEGGDLYAFSEKAVGQDWLKRNSYTLRHAADFKEI